MNKIEEAANLFVEKLKEYVLEDSTYEEEEFEGLVFMTMIETITQTDPKDNIQPEQIFSCAQKRIIDLQLEQIKKQK